MNSVPEIFAHGNAFAIPVVLGAGLIAGFNPCCLAMYPAPAAACCANNSNAACKHNLSSSLLVVLGAALSTALLGIAAALLGRAMGQLGTPVLYVVAFIPMIMGFHLLGWIKPPFKQPLALGVAAATGAAFLSGMVLGIVISACGTPILASVLSYVAYKRNIVFGALLLFLYGIGSSAPVALVGSAAGRVLGRWGSPRSAALANSVTGGLLVATSFYLLWRV